MKKKQDKSQKDMNPLTWDLYGLENKTQVGPSTVSYGHRRPAPPVGPYATSFPTPLPHLSRDEDRMTQ